MEPVNRLQSPTSTVSPNAVSVETPRRHCSRDTVGHHCGSGAISMIALSSRARREVAGSTVSSVVSYAACNPGSSNRCWPSHCS